MRQGATQRQDKGRGYGGKATSVFAVRVRESREGTECLDQVNYRQRGLHCTGVGETEARDEDGEL